MPHVFFTPAAEEIAWARERTASREALLALARYFRAGSAESAAVIERVFDH